MRRPTMDQIYLGIALAAALGSFAWYGWTGRAHGRVRTAPHRPGTACPPPTSRRRATFRSCRPGNGCDPPRRRGDRSGSTTYLPRRRFFMMRARSSSPCPARTRRRSPTASGLELVAVQRTPFRLQLVGYVGGTGRYLGTFENQLTGEVFLAGIRAGGIFAGAGDHGICGGAAAGGVGGPVELKPMGRHRQRARRTHRRDHPVDDWRAKFHG